MLGEVFEFMNSCFPNQKLILKVGGLKLGEEEIKAIEKQKADREANQALQDTGRKDK